MKHRLWLVIHAAFLAILLLQPVVADDHMGKEWQIKVDGKATSAGAITFRLTSAPSEDGTTAEPVTVEVLVAEKAKHKDIQATIKNNFRAKLGDDNYKIKTKGSDRVTIKTKSKTPQFLLEMTNNTAQGISVSVEED